MGVIKKTITIEIGETMSDAIPQNERALVGFTAGSIITAGEITFLGSLDGGVTYHSIYDESAEISVTTASYAIAYALTASKFYPWTHIKLREGNSASAVAQADYDLELTLSFREDY